MKNKKIVFHATSDHVMQVREKPVPASSLIPHWYKDMPILSGKKLDLNPAATITAKKCAPLLDSLTSGYIFTLWADILVTQTEEGPFLRWNTSMDVVGSWPWSQSSIYEIPDSFDKTVFKYYHGWVPETPKGYSCITTHPIGYQNLPFRTITGVIDTDILKTEANSPFVVKSGFEGIIKKGTPMFQLIPFKRDTWVSEFDTLSEKEYFYNIEKLKTKIVSSYSSIRYKKIFR
jgi:hypothetical protein